MAKLITYDLCAPIRNYPNLTNAIQAFPSCQKVTESCWVVAALGTCFQIAEYLRQFVDSNDRLFVAELTDAAWLNVLCQDSDLRQTLAL
jgi:hypothetical protein